MYEVAINTMAFEFDCTNQTSAKKIQHEMLHYAGPALNKIIEKIFAETDAKESYTISKVEIDLGEISVEKFGSYEMLEKFSDCLLKQLKDLKNSFHHALSIRETSSSDIVYRLESERQIIEEFLLNGDLPWWVDKNSNISIAKVIRNVLQKSPATIKDILNKNRYNKTALKRISAYLKTEVSEGNVELQTIAFNDFKRKSWFSDIQIPALDFMTDSGDFINPDYFNVSKSLKKESPKISLLKRLLQSSNQNLTYQIAILNVFSESEMKVIRSFYNSKNNKKNSSKRLIKLFEKLSYLQVAFLLFITKKKINAFQKNQDNIENNSDADTLDSSSDYNNKTSFSATINEKTREIEKQHILPQQQKIENNKDANEVVADDIKQNQKVIKQQPIDIKANENNAFTDYKKVLQFANVDRKEAHKEAENNNDIVASDKVLSQKEASQSSEFITEKANKEIVLANKLINNSGEQHVQTPNKIATDTLQELSVDFDKSGNISRDEKGSKKVDSTTVENQFSNSEKRLTDSVKNTQIAFLIKCLQSNHPNLHDSLHQITEKDLSVISKKLKKYKNKEKKIYKNINSIVKHKYFLSYQLLQTVAFFSRDSEVNENVITALAAGFHDNAKDKVKAIKNFLQKAQLVKALFFSAIKDMSEREAIVINDVLEKRNFSTNSERKIIMAFLNKLPKENIELLKFLTDLPEEAIEQVNKIVTHNISRSEIQKKEKYAEKVQRKVYIDNGGICLIAMYFTGLFNHLKYLEKNVFKNKFLAARALYLLQYLVEGKQKNAEYLLQLNKILCGFQVDETIPANIRLTKKEKSEADTLLKAVIENWRALKNTSLQGFRDSFLHRKAILTEKESYWTMQVERKGHDILLNTIPWNYQTIKFSWMKKMIKVEW